MTTDDHPVTLGALVERAWPVPFDVVRTPRGLDVPLSAPALFDPLSRLSVREGSVLLGVAVDIDRRCWPPATRRAWHCWPSTPRSPGRSCTSCSRRRWPPSQAPLTEVYGDDLFALADALAAMVGGPVVIDDPYLRVLAYSAVDGSVDHVRRGSILGRGLPEVWRSRLEDLGVF